MAKKMLEPGVYSVICLIDDQTWIQPAFRITRPMSEGTFQKKLEANVTRKAFMFLDIVRDDDVPESFVRRFK